ncbi:uncharacterized protein LOC115253473 [Aedes albopictus]|uniref:Secreted protein n=1 Tax=Aedes albopictus TaxID=7160 RepID=A0ABM1Y525_AEDAL
MLLLALKSLFFVAAIMAYSTGVWRLINDYFRQEFRTFLDEEVKKNKYLMVDPGITPLPSPSQIISEGEVRKAQHGSIPANRLLDQMILNFGRLFSAGNEPSHARAYTSAQPTPTNEIITTSTSTDEPAAAASSQPVTDRIGTSLGPESPTQDGATVIESDKFLRSSSPEREDNKSDGNGGDDDANADDDVDGDDDEEKWIKYWKNSQRRGQLPETVGSGGGDGDGHCEAKPVDACGT